MLILLIWLLGIIPSYIYFKWLFRHELDHTWDAILLKSILSLIWPISLLCVFLEIAGNFLKKIKPPKWL